MLIDILMPALSPTMVDGTLIRWVKRIGDSVTPGDVIAEIETDKSVTEIEALDGGTLEAITVAEGTSGVPVGTVIATMVTSGPAAAQTQTGLNPSLHAVPPSTDPPKLTRGETPSAPLDQRIKASPLARAAAGRSKIDIGSISGTGPGGRVIKADVDDALIARTEFTSRASEAQSLDAQKRADRLGLQYTLKPNSASRKAIARRVSEAKQTIPHFYLNIDCNIDRLLEVRRLYNDINPQQKVTLNDFIIRAAALALRAVPDVNVSWGEESILQYRDVDISVAVNSPTGLVTPIIKQANLKDVHGIAREMRDLVARARSGKLKPHEYDGGSFSISNLGMAGIRDFSAIINPPQSCILAIGSGEKRAAVEDDRLTVATIMTCTLSVDHRTVDGSLAAEFLGVFKRLIQDPVELQVANRCPADPTDQTSTEPGDGNTVDPSVGNV